MRPGSLPRLASRSANSVVISLDAAGIPLVASIERDPSGGDTDDIMSDSTTARIAGRPLITNFYRAFIWRQFVAIAG